MTLLYTMEVWWVGRSVPPSRALVLLGIGFVVVYVLSSAGGFHGTQKTTVMGTVVDTVEALALALLISAGLLWLLRVITADTPVQEALGKIVVEGVPIALGVVLADFFMDKEKDQSSQQEPAVRGTLIDLGATVVGAGVIGLTIAPTQEVPMLHAMASPVSLLAVMAVSLALTYALVFVSGFSNEKKRRQQPGVLQRPLTETVVAYLAALIVTALMLWFFDNLALGAPLHESIGHVIVLGLPAAVGGALGRIVI
ncbi:TIGR02587 family membrane protein [Kocuria oceani]|uniref:TIGR02587 family membrane protein n=1 Tax=Kocuria oceani TaxID=988827 RepID=UPI0040366A02